MKGCVDLEQKLSLRRVIAEKLALTALIAGVGALIVAFHERLGLWAAFLGLLIVALSPAISYAIILYRIKSRVKGKG